MRIVVLGGGFAGVAAVRRLERVLRRRTDVEITLVSRENFFVRTPFLFEACSGRLELRHCAQPIRAALQRAPFIEAAIESVDLERHLVRAVVPKDGVHALPYDRLVVALGASTNDGLIPGSSNALTYKTMADALVLRNHLIECFERADAAADAAERHWCLAVVPGGDRKVSIRTTLATSPTRAQHTAGSWACRPGTTETSVQSRHALVAVRRVDSPHQSH